MRPDLPTGTVTFLFTDVEGSTRLLHSLGAESYGRTLAEHRRVLREAFSRHGGVEVDTQGDAFFVAFPTAEGAIRAAEEAQQALADGPIRVRMGIHTGTPVLTGEGYVGPDVHRAARIAAAGHGGQVLVSSATAGLLGAVGLRDLGERRLKDLSAPERIHQLEDRDFPPLKTLYQTNLPVPTTTFVGREHEVAEVAARLRDGAGLLTLTGPGGTGKTRLALQAAAAVAESFPDGVWWVPLTPLRDPALVLPTAAGAVGASGDLAEHIADKRLLLLFDNFEQVVDAAADVGGLLARCPRLKMLVTSRELLQLPGEQAYPVPPLARDESVELFLTRARAVQPGFDGNGTITVLCDRLDDLPLAVELAAARVRMLSPEQLLQRLGQRLDLLKGGRGVDDRQQTLRATIEWSHDLLDAGEQSLFARLAVFRGGWTLEAAEAICDADMDILQSLVDKSLIRARDERFFMLETMREYAAERLEGSGQGEELRRRHAEYFIRLAAEAEPHLRLDSVEWLDQLERERDNLRATFDRLGALGEARLVLGLAGMIFRFWYMKGHLIEGAQRLERALDADLAPTLERAKALSAASVMAINLGRNDAALAAAEQSLELHRQLGDRWGEAYAEMMVGNALAELRQLDRALPCLERAAEMFGEFGDQHYALISRTNVAWVVGDLRGPAAEELIHEENLRLSRALGAERMEAGTLASLAMIAAWEETPRLDEAAGMLREAIRIHHRRGDRRDVAMTLSRLANVLAMAGLGATGAPLLARSETLFEELGVTQSWWMSERNEKTLQLLRDQLGEAALANALERGRRLTVEQAVELALADRA